jgi:hypothetical protein
VKPEASINELRAAISLAVGDDNRVKTVLQENLKNITSADWKKYRAGNCTIGRNRWVLCGVVGSDADIAYLPDLPAGTCWEILLCPGVSE